MIAVPRGLAGAIGGAFAAYAVVIGVLHILDTGTWLTGCLAIVLFALAAAVLLTGLCEQRLALPRALAGAGVAVVLPLVASTGIDPVRGSFTSGAWYVAGVTGLVVLLLWRRRAAFAWVSLGALVVHTYLWSGPRGLAAFGVVAAALVIGLLAAGGAALAQAERELQRFSSAEHDALEWRAEQDAYHLERQVRLMTTSRLADDMLQRIVTAGGRLETADRAECRVLEQTIRDEIRGRRLLNDAVRAQVLAHRRRGAFVQVHDDGGLDALDPVAVEAMLDQVAAALDGLRSDTIVLRTAPADSERAITVVATSSDPVAAALGLDDDPQVDLWLELDRAPRAAV